jgi:hypothetical protein
MHSRKYRRALRHLQWDLLILVASILLAFALVEAGAFTWLLSLSEGLELVAAFTAGVLFTSMFTIAAATVAFVEIGNSSNVLLISLVGALGAVCGDMLLFLFIRDTLAEDLRTVVRGRQIKKIFAYFHGGIFRWLSPVLGALIIASPFPDELGLALMGMSKVRSLYMIPITFVMNFIGIWAVISIAIAV